MYLFIVHVEEDLSTDFPYLTNICIMHSLSYEEERNEPLLPYFQLINGIFKIFDFNSRKFSLILMDFLKLYNLEDLDPRMSPILTEGKMLPFVKFGNFW
jgi:hypothetical protein